MVFDQIADQLLQLFPLLMLFLLLAEQLFFFRTGLLQVRPFFPAALDFSGKGSSPRS